MRNLSLVLFLSLIAPVTVWCQQDAAPAESPAITIYGSGDRPSMTYAGEQLPTNALLIDMGYTASYDDNPLGVTSSPAGDEVQSVNGHVQWLHQGDRFNTLLEYQPYYQWFHKYDAFNSLSQFATADVLWKMTPQWSARLRNDYADLRGTYGLPNSQFGSPRIGPPSGLNSTIYAPINNERDEIARADLQYLASPRTSVDIFAGFAQRTFPGSTNSVFGTQGESGGAEYTWRATEHATLGLVLQGERMDLSGTLLAGSATRMESVSLMPALGWRPRPTVELNLYGGPQVIRQSGVYVDRSPLQTEWAGGGSIEKQTESTTFLLAADRVATDGGGLLSFVVSTDFRAGLRQRIHRDWNLNADFEYANNRWIPITTGTGRLISRFGTVGVSRPVGRKMVFSLGYDFVSQSPSGELALGDQFARNRVTSSITWNWHGRALGR